MYIDLVCVCSYIHIFSYIRNQKTNIYIYICVRCLWCLCVSMYRYIHMYVKTYAYICIYIYIYLYLLKILEYTQTTASTWVTLFLSYGKGLHVLWPPHCPRYLPDIWCGLHVHNTCHIHIEIQYTCIYIHIQLYIYVHICI